MGHCLLYLQVEEDPERPRIFGRCRLEQPSPDASKGEMAIGWEQQPEGKWHKFHWDEALTDLEPVLLNRRPVGLYCVACALEDAKMEADQITYLDLEEAGWCTAQQQVEDT